VGIAGVRECGLVCEFSRFWCASKACVSVVWCELIRFWCEWGARVGVVLGKYSRSWCESKTCVHVVFRGTAGLDVNGWRGWVWSCVSGSWCE